MFMLGSPLRTFHTLRSLNMGAWAQGKEPERLRPTSSLFSRRCGRRHGRPPHPRSRASLSAPARPALSSGNSGEPALRGRRAQAPAVSSPGLPETRREELPMGQARVAWAPKREPHVPGGTAQGRPRIPSGREDGAVGGKHNGPRGPRRRGGSCQLWQGPCHRAAASSTILARERRPGLGAPPEVRPPRATQPPHAP